MHRIYREEVWQPTDGKYSNQGRQMLAILYMVIDIILFRIVRVTQFRRQFEYPWFTSFTNILYII
jgi:hypothetical protein